MGGGGEEKWVGGVSWGREREGWGSRRSDRGGKNELREWWRRGSANSLSGSDSLHRGPFLCEGR